MPSYSELKNELVQISLVLEKFPEELRGKVYDLLIAEFLGYAPPVDSDRTKHSVQPAKKKVSQKGESLVQPDVKTPVLPKIKHSSSNKSYSIERDLNLRGDGSIPSFKDFFTAKAPKSAMEFNTVAVYYLRKIMGLTAATLNHAYTCYSEVGRKPPIAFKQSFIDAKNKNGWLEFDESGNINIPHRGSVFVEHDLPHLEKTKE